MSENKSRTILEMNNIEARKFLLKQESYFTLNLPAYFQLSNLIDKAKCVMGDPESNGYLDANKLDGNKKPKYVERDDLNYTIYTSKDGLYSWRPITIINPFLYVDLVNYITTNEISKNKIGNGWEFIQRRFTEFQSNKKIFCASIPRESQSTFTDTGATILNWWEEIEQRTIEKSIEYTYCLFCDIANFYPSIYTHSIPWALYEKDEVKNNLRKFNGSFGDHIDIKIRGMQCNQTNGIHQGSVLMDFIAEIVLGYIDLILTRVLQENSITNYYIIRYRDDYRIFSNNKTEIEIISKHLQQALLTFNLNLASAKTFVTQDIVTDAIKKDKRYWEPYRISIRASNFHDHEGKITLQKYLLQIHELSKEFPNSGMIKKALSEFYDERISNKEEQPDDFKILISILVDIMYRNPNSISYCVIIIAKLLENTVELGIDIIDNILEKYSVKANTEYVEIWLQRLAIMVYGKNSEKINELFDSKICRKILLDDQFELFPSDWINTSIIYSEPSIIDKDKFNSMEKGIQKDEIDNLKSYDDYYYLYS